MQIVELIIELAIAICLSVKAFAGRRSAAFALNYFDALLSGWTPGRAFFTGLLPVSARMVTGLHKLTLVYIVW